MSGAQRDTSTRSHAYAGAAAFLALAAPPAMHAHAGAAALLASAAPPAMPAYASAAALLASAALPPAVLAEALLANHAAAAGRSDAHRRHPRLRPPCARRRHHGCRLLLVGVGGVVERLRSRPPLASPGRRRHLVEAGVAVGQRAAAEHPLDAFESGPVSLSRFLETVREKSRFLLLDEGLCVSELEGTFFVP